MLLELRVRDLLLIESVELELSPGLNVLTGETGAGKTLLATALGLLLGDRSRSGLVRPGAAEAWVEGVFEIPSDLDSELVELVGEGMDEIVLARRIWPDGRSRASICGRTVTVTDLRRLGEALFSFHGQHEHRRLALAGFQLDLLDGFIGSQQLQLRQRMALAYSSARSAERHLEPLSGVGESGQREADLLRFELAEIEALDPSQEDHSSLVGEREILGNADTLLTVLNSVRDGLVSETGEGGVSSDLGTLGSLLVRISGISGEVDGLAERLSSLLAEVDDLATDTRHLIDSIESDPRRLIEVDERLAEYDRLERKHGGSLESLLSHREIAGARLEELAGLEGAAEKTRDELNEARAQCDSIASQLSSARKAQASVLASRVEQALEDLSLAGASFSIEVSATDSFTPDGFDSVVFNVAANPGIPEAPLSEAASGGETSRILLALLGSCTEASVEDGARGLVVFDEIDAGIGGRTAKAVGERLAQLSQSDQILCITHLPQVAARAERHFRIVKESREELTTTTIDVVEGESLVDEMIRLLGGAASDDVVRAHALELLAQR